MSTATSTGTSRMFDAENKNFSIFPEQNKFFLQSVQSFMNDLLHARGYLTINEVYESLGFERDEKDGDRLGWTGKDAYVDFGLYRDGVGPIESGFEIIFNTSSTTLKENNR